MGIHFSTVTQEASLPRARIQVQQENLVLFYGTRKIYLLMLALEKLNPTLLGWGIVDKHKAQGSFLESRWRYHDQVDHDQLRIKSLNLHLNDSSFVGVNQVDTTPTYLSCRLWDKQCGIWVVVGHDIAYHAWRSMYTFHEVITWIITFTPCTLPRLLKEREGTSHSHPQEGWVGMHTLWPSLELGGCLCTPCFPLPLLWVAGRGFKACLIWDVPPDQLTHWDQWILSASKIVSQMNLKVTVMVYDVCSRAVPMEYTKKSGSSGCSSAGLYQLGGTVGYGGRLFAQVYLYGALVQNNSKAASRIINRTYSLAPTECLR